MYLGGYNDWHFYQCEGCGSITLPPDGLMRSTMESDFEAVKHRKRNTARDKPPFFWAASA